MKVLKDQQLERRVSVECGNQYGCVAQILPPIRCSSAAFTNQSPSIYQCVCSSTLPNHQYVCSLCSCYHQSIRVCCSATPIGYGSTDLRLFTSTKLKIVNYWFYTLMHKKQNL
jgi:hypothetical protein